jgi:signal transduction histidine kinase
MRTKPFNGLTIRAALALGFGLTLGLWLFAGYQFTRRMSEVQQGAASINQRYMRAQERLSTIRNQVLLGSVLVRDALLDPDPKTVTEYRRRFDVAYNSADQALRKYIPVMGNSPIERDRVQQLRTEIESFRAVMLELLSSDRSQWPTEARNLMRSRINPRRDVVIRISEEAQALNRSAFIQQQSASAEIYGVSQRWIWEELGLALLASLAIAVFASLYAGRLETRLRIQLGRNAQSTNDLHRLSAEIVRVQEEERRSIARELHDEVGQVLTAIKVELASAQRAIDTAGGSPVLLDNARTIADGALHTVRDLSQLLHPPLLDDLGLAAAVNRHLHEFGKRHGLRVELLEENMEKRLGADVESAAYRVVQEALTNVAKHAHASKVLVQLRRLPSIILVAVEDDGVGFSSERTRPSDGLGLIGIRERVSQLKGSIRIESAPGRGTSLRVELPAPVRAETTDLADAGHLRPAAAGGRLG